LKENRTQKESFLHSGRLEEASFINFRRFEGMCNLSSSKIAESENKVGNPYTGYST